MADGFGACLAQLEPVDWDRVRREPFHRAFLELPAQEGEGVDASREALGIRIEDRCGEPVLPPPAATFEELQALPRYALEGLHAHGITTPLPVQAQAMPLILSGYDVIGLAQTGSGKTLAFLLPAIVHIEAQRPLARKAATPIALILAPTRELAVQISDEASKVLKRSKEGRHRSGIWPVCLYGGGRRLDQVKALSWGAHIVVATPGRLIDFVSSRVVSLERVTYFVLDEADRMLDLGFHGDVAAISSQVRPDRQVLFFSATWSAAVQQLASGLCHHGARPVRISVGQDGGEARAWGDPTTHHARDSILQEVVVIDYPDEPARQVAEKERLLDEHLQRVLTASEDNKILVFVSQKQFADDLANKLWEAGFKVGAMHGGKSQDSRLWTLEQFRRGDLRLLVATDVIGRGIDIPSVSHVVVFEMGTVEDYVHRIGRTARGQNGKGHALVFFEYWHKDPSIAGQLVELLKASRQTVPQALQRIADEVAWGKRQGAEPKWFGGKWKDSGSVWSSERSWGQETAAASHAGAANDWGRGDGNSHLWSERQAVPWQKGDAS